MKRKWVVIFSLVLIIGGLFLYLKKIDFFPRMTFHTWSLPLTGRIIYLDPGHGGPDGGADSGDAVESEISLSIAKKLRTYLEGQGALVLMTRETDTDLAEEGTRGLSRRKVQDLHRRAELINESEAELFISIHLNAIPSSRWRGAQTFYSPRYVENKIAAEMIQEEFIDNLENTNRKARTIQNVYLLKTVKKPGVLVEAGFLSNPEERDLLMDEKYQDKVAFSLYEGIMRYFTDEREDLMEREKTTEKE